MVTPDTSRILGALPRDPGELRGALLEGHDARGGDLGCAWWKIVRDAYEGTGGFARSLRAASTMDARAADFDRLVGAGNARSTYLTPFSRESPEQFQSRADRSGYTNFVAPIIDTYHGHLTRHRATRTSTSDVVNAWWSKVDAEGHDIGEFMALVTKRAQLDGWCAVLTDRPKDPTQRAGVTTSTILDPEEIRDWQYGRDGALEWVKIVSEWETEDPTDGVEVEVCEASYWTRAEWARVRMETRKTNGREQVSVTTDAGDNPTGRVPVSVLRWQDSVRCRTLYGLSQVYCVVPLVLALFNVESELTHHLACVNFAFLAVNSDDTNALANLKIGTQGGMRYGIGEEAPQFIAPPESVALQYALRSEQLTRSIYTAAKLERPDASATGGDAASGVAKAYDFAQTDATLQGFARQCVRFEFDMVDAVARWDSTDSAAEVIAATSIQYPKRFDARGIADDLGAMFAVLDEKIRAQFPPEVLRQARLALARMLFPEADTATEDRIAAQIETMYTSDSTSLSAQRDAKPQEVFGYDLDAGILTVDEVRAIKGFPPYPDGLGKVSTLEWKARIDAAVKSMTEPGAQSVGDAIDALPLATGATTDTVPMTAAQ
jgi:hypothetical protein